MFYMLVGVKLFMKNEVLESIKQQYEWLKIQQLRYQSIFDRLKRLEENEFVREYLELSSSVKNIKRKDVCLSEDDLIEVSYLGNVCYIEDTNGIYVCVGEVDLHEMTRYKRYINIESSKDSVLVPLDECEMFEKTHQVVFMNMVPHDVYSAIRKYRDAQKDFIKTAIEEGQEKACQKVLSKKY